LRLGLAVLAQRATSHSLAQCCGDDLDVQTAEGRVTNGQHSRH